MSFLEVLLNTPAEWDRIWRRDALGSLRYLPRDQRHYDLAALRVLDRSEAEGPTESVEDLESIEKHERERRPANTCSAKELPHYILRGNDRDYQNALDNPSIALADILFLLERRSPGSSTLRKIFNHGRFGSNATVTVWLIRNPHTPIKLARKALKRVGKHALREFARSNTIKRELKSVAQRLLTKRKNK